MTEEIKALLLSDRAVYPKVVTLIKGDKDRPLFEQIQQYTDGVFTVVYPDNYEDESALKDYVIYMNDEALYTDGMTPNIAIRPELMKEKKWDYAGILFGPILVVKPDHATGDDLTLENDEIPLIIEALQEKMLVNKYRKEFIERGAQ